MVNWKMYHLEKRRLLKLNKSPSIASEQAVEYVKNEEAKEAELIAGCFGKTTQPA